MKLEELRKKHPRFIYHSYSYKFIDNILEISFKFQIEPDIFFYPKIKIKGERPVDAMISHRSQDEMLNNMIFHLGLMEIPSYWKATCSPEIIVKAGHLNHDQIKWWKELIIDGMGQFFFENKIDFRPVRFLSIKSAFPETEEINMILEKQSNKALVGVGGGKDSALTLDIFRKASVNFNCFSLNPTKSAGKIMEVAGCNNPVIIERQIDEKLLKLNQNGYLNGHTPFSAYLAFLSSLIAVIFNYRYIVFSNERSSNEGNIRYLGKVINHQWSKSIEFETRFRQYLNKYLVKNLEYFSFLRPLYEIQIAKVFSNLTDYLKAFLSCNEAYKTDSGRKKPGRKWCGQCSKCLFVFAILYPFVETKDLVKIFRKNLFNDSKLWPIAKELIGEKDFKPFECVGTVKESRAAFYLSCKKNEGLKKMPLLLKRFEKLLIKYPGLEKEANEILSSRNNQNYLPSDFLKILKSNLLD